MRQCRWSGINGQINMNIGGAFGGPFAHDPLNPPRVGNPGQLLDIHLWDDFHSDGMLDSAATDGEIYYDMGISVTSGPNGPTRAGTGTGDSVQVPDLPGYNVFFGVSVELP